MLPAPARSAAGGSRRADPCEPSRPLLLHPDRMPRIPAEERRSSGVEDRRLVEGGRGVLLPDHEALSPAAADDPGRADPLIDPLLDGDRDRGHPGIFGAFGAQPELFGA